MRARKHIEAFVVVAAFVFAARPAGAAEERGQKETRLIEPEPFTTGIVWAEPEVGVQTIDLTTFSAKSDTLTLGVLPTHGVGPMGGMGAGVRFWFITLGARARLAAFDDTAPDRTVGGWNVVSLDGELGLRFPLGRVEPHIRLGGGYTGVGALDDAVGGATRGIDVRGANARAGAGVDVFVARHLTLGGAVTGEVIALARDGSSLRDLAEPKQVDTGDQAKARLLEGSGSTVGSSVTFTAGAGLHF